MREVGREGGATETERGRGEEGREKVRLHVCAHINVIFSLMVFDCEYGTTKSKINTRCQDIICLEKLGSTEKSKIRRNFVTLHIRDDHDCFC